jgi:hypothetical protein
MAEILLNGTDKQVRRQLRLSRCGELRWVYYLGALATGDTRATIYITPPLRG